MENPQSPRPSSDIIILSISALLLAALTLFAPSRDRMVFAADGMTHSGGDYILTVGKVQKTPEQYPEELLYVIDMAVGKLGVYSLDPQSGRILARDFKDLRNLGGPGAGQPQPPPTRGVRPPPTRNP